MERLSDLMTDQQNTELDAPDPPEGEVTKYRVTMRNFTGFDPVSGQALSHEAVDHVPQEILDAYTADARTRWGFVEVSKEPDAGPAGYHGATYYPAHLPIPNAGEYRPPTPGSTAERLLLQAEAEAAARGGQPPDTGEPPAPPQPGGARVEGQ
jgi:hypothetical protein